MCAKNNENDTKKKSAKHKPPSRIRFEKANPVWSVRMPLQWHKDYEIYVQQNGLSRKMFMGVSLGKIKLDYENVTNQTYNQGFADGAEQGHEQGYQEGYVKGKKEGCQEGKVEGSYLAEKYYRIRLYCPECNQTKDLVINSLTYYFLLDFLQYYDWVCLDCYNKRFYR